MSVASPDPQSLPERDREALERIATAREAESIERALEAARERLRMDAAYVTTIGPSSQEIGELAGDASALGFSTGTELPLEETYCTRMLVGELPNVVPDTSAVPAVRGLDLTARIRAYVGVPITLSDGAVHGTLCCASGEPRTELGDEELTFMHVLADIVATQIDRSRRPGSGVLVDREGASSD